MAIATLSWQVTSTGPRSSAGAPKPTGLVYPQVYVDVGLTMTHLGVRARHALGEYFELAPFGKLMCSTDAYGLPELYCVGAAQFRAALRGLLDAWLADDALSTADAGRIARQICAGNAQRVYGL
jgi:hypothetical protein